MKIYPDNILDTTTNGVRVVSYNITADFFDKKDWKQHNWEERKLAVKKLLKSVNADIMCLQELSPEQAIYLVDSFPNFHFRFLSQTVGEITPTGSVVSSKNELLSWEDKRCGTPLIGIFTKKNVEILDANRFWFNENQDEIPVNTDRSKTDKGFGNMNTYRAVLWIKAKYNDKDIYVFNSHYPLSGNSETRYKCAELEVKKIQEITNGSFWISSGDRNLIPDDDDTLAYKVGNVYNKLTEFGIDATSQNHIGPRGTWSGFYYDDYKCDKETEKVLDIIVTNMKPEKSFCHIGMYKEEGRELIDLSSYTADLPEYDNRFFASDHRAVVADLKDSYHFSD